MLCKCFSLQPLAPIMEKERKPRGAEVLVLGPRTGREPRLTAYPEMATEEQQNRSHRSVAPQWPIVPLPYWHCLLLLLAT